jgi:hypothetical protein
MTYLAFLLVFLIFLGTGLTGLYAEDKLLHTGKITQLQMDILSWVIFAAWLGFAMFMIVMLDTKSPDSNWFYFMRVI